MAMASRRLIHLSWIDQIDLLGRIFEEVFVPPAVRDEVFWRLLQAPSGWIAFSARLLKGGCR